MKPMGGKKANIKVVGYNITILSLSNEIAILNKSTKEKRRKKCVLLSSE